MGLSGITDGLALIIFRNSDVFGTICFQCNIDNFVLRFLGFNWTFFSFDLYSWSSWSYIGLREYCLVNHNGWSILGDDEESDDYCVIHIKYYKRLKFKEDKLQKCSHNKYWANLINMKFKKTLRIRSASWFHQTITWVIKSRISWSEMTLSVCSMRC